VTDAGRAPAGPTGELQHSPRFHSCNRERDPTSKGKRVEGKGGERIGRGVGRDRERRLRVRD